MLLRAQLLAALVKLVPKVLPVHKAATVPPVSRVNPVLPVPKDLLVPPVLPVLLAVPWDQKEIPVLLVPLVPRVLWVLRVQRVTPV